MTDEQFDDFELTIAFADDRVTVGVQGEVDVLTVPTLEGVLSSLIDAGHRTMVLDLAESTFMDASGLGVLARVAARLGEAGGTIGVRSIPALTRHILDVTGVSDLIELDETVTGSSLGPEEQIEDGERTGPAALAAARRTLGKSNTDVVDAALRLVTALADATVENADGVSVTLERHGRLMTVAASNEKVLTMDRHQYETGEGPCLAAKAEGRWYYIEALEDEARWPAFVPLALGQGIHSILSSPLMTRDRPQGALNIYSSKQRAFSSREQELAALFAEQASAILTTAGPGMTDEQSKAQFVDALTARQTIHQAQGVLMARENLTAEESLGSLIRLARAADVTVLSYATQVVTSADDGSRK
jgi:anti-anti-sigma factor